MRAVPAEPASLPALVVGSLLCLGAPLAPLSAATPPQAAAARELPARDFTFATPLFAAESAWNQRADGAAVAPTSDAQILVTYRVLRGDTTSLFPPGPPPTTWPYMDINLDDFSVAIFRLGSADQRLRMRDYEGNLTDGSSKLPLPDAGGYLTVPAAAVEVRPANPRAVFSDGHLVLYDPATFATYDYWQATTALDGLGDSLGGGQVGTAVLEAGAIELFDVRETGANPDTFSSARACGTPLLAGLILPEDVERGSIDHALAVAIPNPRNLNLADPYEPLSTDYFYPASTTEGDYYSRKVDALASGQRLRLKPSIVGDDGLVIDESGLAPITAMFLSALRRHGAYVIDNAGGFTFYAEDYHSASLDLTDDQTNALIGQPAGTPLPVGQTRWQVVLEKLNRDLWDIPFAHGPWQAGQDPATATIDIANFEVVANATRHCHPLLLDAQPGAGGSVSASPLPGCGGDHDSGEVVTLTAQAAPGWRFSGWGGDASGSANPHQVIVDRAKSVTALFSAAVCADPNEPNDTLASSTAIAGADLTTFLTGTCILATADADWFRLTATAGQLLTAIVRAEGIPSPLDPRLRVYDAGGSLVASNDDLSPDLRDARLAVATAAGAYHLEVTAQNTNTGDYQLRAYLRDLTSPADFSDVPPSHLFHDFIRHFSAASITSGCGAARFCPDAWVTRGQMAVFLDRALGADPDPGGPPRFTDVPATHPFYGWIQRLAGLGVTQGCAATEYCPDATVSRGQMAVFVNRALGVPPRSDLGPTYSDVPPGHPFYGWIESFASQGITGGCGAGSYCPAAPVTRGQMAVFMTRAFGLDAGPSGLRSGSAVIEGAAVRGVELPAAELERVEPELTASD